MASVQFFELEVKFILAQERNAVRRSEASLVAAPSRLWCEKKNTVSMCSCAHMLVVVVVVACTRALNATCVAQPASNSGTHPHTVLFHSVDFSTTIMVKRIVAAAAALGAWVAQGTMVLGQGPDAAGQLPAVEAVLTKADGKAVDFAAQAMAMQKMVEESQRKGREALATQKADYEKQLTEQATASRAVVDRNTAISNQISHVRKTNSELKEDTSNLQAGNIHMRKILQQISDKVDAANLFVSDSLKLTDDSGAEELKVLEPTTPRPTLNRFLEQAGASLLQISKPDHGSNTPEDLVQVLSRSLTDIADAQKEGAAELKAHFLASFEEGRVKQQDLLAQQKNLNATLEEELGYQRQLTAAKEHLVSTRDSLKQRLHGLRIFARKLDQTAHDVLSADTVKAAQQFMESHQAKLVDVAATKQVPSSTSVTSSTTLSTTTTTMTTTTMTTTTTTTTTTSTTTSTTTTVKGEMAAEKVKSHHARKEKQAKAEKVAALVESSSTSEKKVEKPAATTAKKEATEDIHKPSAATATKAPTRAEEKHPAQTRGKKEAPQGQQPASRLHSWWASWR